MIASFNEQGNLPPGIHSATWDEFSKRFGFNHYRKKILAGMKSALDNLKASGCKKVYLDGSFTTDKNRPGDFDGCWEVDGIDLEQLDSVLQDFSNGRKAQKGKYYGELFPSTAPNPSGTMLDFFQQDKETGDIKGIISFDLEEFS